ncbi:MAG TPA: hypothetical protein DIT97_23080, partial [Gimesia maris]|nr:hypothetical protein [Gimesia maris]
MMRSVDHGGRLGSNVCIVFGWASAFAVLALVATAQARESSDIGGATRSCGVESSVGCGNPEQPSERELIEQFGHWEKGKAHLKQGRFKEAVEAFTSAIQIGHNAGVLYLARGNAYRQLGQLDMALSDYSDAIRIEPYL